MKHTAQRKRAPARKRNELKKADDRNVRYWLTLTPKTVALLKKYARFLKQSDTDKLLDDICHLLLAHERFGGLVEIFGAGMAFMEAIRYPRRPEFLSSPLTEEARRQMVLGFLKIRPGKRMDKQTADAVFTPDKLSQKDLDSIKAYLKSRTSRPRAERIPRNGRPSKGKL